MRELLLSHDDFKTLVRLGPLVSIDLIVYDPDGRVLVGLRENEPAKNWWFVPGGSIRKTQTLDEAFAVICNKELGQPFDRGDATLLGVYEHHYDTNFSLDPSFGTHYIVLAHELRLDQPIDNLPTDQHGQYAWLTPEQILAHNRVHENTKAYWQ